MSSLTRNQTNGLKRIPEGWNSASAIQRAGVPFNILVALQSKGAVSFRGQGPNKEYSVNQYYHG